MSPDERKTEIMRSLVAIMRERQVSSLTMQDIADRLGMTKGNLYYYFRSKQDILFQCYLKAMKHSLGVLAEIGSMEGSPRARLHALIKRLISVVIEHPYGAVLMTDLDQLSTSHRRRYVAIRDKVDMAVREIVQDGIKAGEFRFADAKMAGLAILGAINSIARWYDPKGPRRPAEIAEMYADLFIGGLKN